MADAGENAVKDEELPQVGDEAGSPPAAEDAQPGKGEQHAGAPAVQQDAQQRRDNRPNKAGQGEYGRGVGGAVAESAPQLVVIDGLAVLGAALDGEIAEGQYEDHPAVVEAGTGGFQHQDAGRRRRRGIWRGQSIGRLYTPAIRHAGVPPDL